MEATRMNTRLDPDGEENQRMTRENENEVRRLKMMELPSDCKDNGV